MQGLRTGSHSLQATRCVSETKLKPRSTPTTLSPARAAPSPPRTHGCRPPDSHQRRTTGTCGSEHRSVRLVQPTREPTDKSQTRCVRALLVCCGFSMWEFARARTKQATKFITTLLLPGLALRQEDSARVMLTPVDSRSRRQPLPTLPACVYCLSRCDEEKPRLQHVLHADSFLFSSLL